MLRVGLEISNSSLQFVSRSKLLNHLLFYSNISRIDTASFFLNSGNSSPLFLTHALSINTSVEQVWGFGGRQQQRSWQRRDGVFTHSDAAGWERCSPDKKVTRNVEINILLQYSLHSQTNYKGHDGLHMHTIQLLLSFFCNHNPNLTITQPRSGKTDKNPSNGQKLRQRCRKWSMSPWDEQTRDGCCMYRQMDGPLILFCMNVKCGYSFLKGIEYAPHENKPKTTVMVYFTSKDMLPFQIVEKSGFLEEIFIFFLFPSILIVKIWKEYFFEDICASKVQNHDIPSIRRVSFWDECELLMSKRVFQRHWQNTSVEKKKKKKSHAVHRESDPGLMDLLNQFCAGSVADKMPPAVWETMSESVLRQGELRSVSDEWRWHRPLHCDWPFLPSSTRPKPADNL